MDSEPKTHGCRRDYPPKGESEKFDAKKWVYLAEVHSKIAPTKCSKVAIRSTEMKQVYLQK